MTALRGIDGLRDKGKVHPSFHFKSRPFLHFHFGEDGTYADVRLGADWEKMPAATPAERRALVALVGQHVAAHRARR